MSASIELLTIGTALVDSIIKGFDPKPVSASGYRAESGTLSVGGEAVNGAIAAAKLGVRTAILCSLGNDSAGTLVTAALEANGVDTGRIVRSDEHPTPVTTMFVRDDGSRQSITNTAHRYHFHPERFLGDLTGVRAVVLGSLFRAPFDDPEVISAVLKAVKSQGILIAADTKLPNFRFLSLADLKEVLPLIDYITPNEDEARYYTSKSDPQELAEVFLLLFSECGEVPSASALTGRGCRRHRGRRHLPCRFSRFPSERRVRAGGASVRQRLRGHLHDEGRCSGGAQGPRAGTAFSGESQGVKRRMGGFVCPSGQ